MKTIKNTSPFRSTLLNQTANEMGRDCYVWIPYEYERNTYGIKQIKCGIQIAYDNINNFQAALRFRTEYGNPILYFLDTEHKSGNYWYRDSIHFDSFRLWYWNRYGLLLSLQDIDYIMCMCMEDIISPAPVLIPNVMKFDEIFTSIKRKTCSYKANLLEIAAEKISNFRSAKEYGCPLDDWIKGNPLATNNVKCAFQIACDLKEIFMEGLLFVNGVLYFNDIKHRESNPWYEDNNYRGLRSWYERRYGIILSNKEMKKLIDFCVTQGIIPQEDKDTFQARVLADILLFESKEMR